VVLYDRSAGSREEGCLVKASLGLRIALILLAAGRAGAADLTGTYAGRLTCRWTSAAGVRSTTRDDLMLEVSESQISATRSSVNMRIPSVASYFGNVIFDPRAPTKNGTGVVNDCTHLWSPNAFVYETVRFTSSSVPGGLKGKIEMEGIVDHSGSDGSIGLCSGSFSRADATDPDVTFCPVVPPGPPGPNAYHVVLNGIGSQVIAADSYPGILGTGARTVSWWYRSHVNTFPPVWGLIFWGQGPAGMWSVQLEDFDGGGINLELYGTKIAWTANQDPAMGALQDGKWHHLAMTAPTAGTAADVKLYMDGVLLPTVYVVGGQLALSYDTLAGIAFRAGSRDLGNYSDADFDEIALWDVELSAAAISEMFNGGAPTDLTKNGTNYQSASALQLYWRFEEGTGLATADSSGNGHGGTISAGDPMKSWGAPGANH